MDTSERMPLTLSGFIHFCGECNEHIRVNGEWVKSNRLRSLRPNGTFVEGGYILGVTLDHHDLIFTLKDKKGNEFRKVFPIKDVGWLYDTYGIVTFLHRTNDGKDKIYFIS